MSKRQIDHAQMPAEPEKPTQSRMKRLARKHARLLSYLGISLVFLTFVIREGLREELKEGVDSLDSVTNAYVLAGDIHRVNQYVAELSHDFLDSGSSMHSFAIATGTPDSLSQLALFMNNSDALHAELGSVKRFALKLPSGSRFVDRVDAQLKILTNLDGRRQLALDKQAAAASSNSHEPNADWAAVESLGRDMSKLTDSANALIQEVFAYAEDIQARSEKRYAWAKWVSYALYLIGFLLGLVGRFAEVDIPTGTELG